MICDFKLPTNLSFKSENIPHLAYVRKLLSKVIIWLRKSPFVANYMTLLKLVTHVYHLPLPQDNSGIFDVLNGSHHLFDSLWMNLDL